jgi:tripartite-type tricarboxylate transporter receptor subunit TctC
LKNFLIALLNYEVNLGLNSLDVKKTLFDAGIDVSTSSPDNLLIYMTKELDRWGHVVKDAGISLE